LELERAGVAAAQPHDEGDVRAEAAGEVAPIIEAGGLFPYAKKVGMLKA